MATSNITFEPAEFDFHVTATTDAVSFEYSRQLPPPEGAVDYDDTRLVYESSESEAKMGIHYTRETLIGVNDLWVYCESGNTRAYFEELHLIPFGPKAGHEADSDEPLREARDAYDKPYRG